jgi:hypothetical protein
MMVSWRLTSGRQRAEILARGAALRTYEVDGRAIVDGFDADEGFQHSMALFSRLGRTGCATAPGAIPARAFNFP